jgi:4-hydroxyphenylpyruvate dioxygenase
MQGGATRMALAPLTAPWAERRFGSACATTAASRPRHGCWPSTCTAARATTHGGEAVYIVDLTASRGTGSGALNRTRYPHAGAARMADLYDNPMGLMGFEFVEFASPTPNVLEPLFEKMGFSLVARHRSKDVLLFRQGDINFIVNREPKSLAGYFAAEHGPSACALAFRVKDSHKAYARALELGAQPMDVPTGPMELRLPAIKGIGGAALYLIDRYEDGKSIYDIDFEFIDGVERHPRGHGLRVIDHLTHNVYRGRMAFWSAFYEKLFNFREIRYFDIKGEYTGLTSRAMTAPDGLIRIPLNEESGKGGSGQIEEFLMQFNGEGIQHIALLSDDLMASVDALQMAGVPLMSAPNDIYYEMLEERVPGHGEPVAELQARGILLDGSTAGGDKRLLLQIFSQTLLGPVFFEFIQRKSDEGFGEGNFKALFESLERDQIRRGALKVEV